MNNKLVSSFIIGKDNKYKMKKIMAQDGNFRSEVSSLVKYLY